MPRPRAFSIGSGPATIARSKSSSGRISTASSAWRSGCSAMPPRRRRSPRKPSCALIARWATSAARPSSRPGSMRSPRRLCLNRLAAGERRLGRQGEETLLRLPHRGAGPDAALEQSELEAALHRAIAELPDERRIVVVAARPGGARVRGDRPGPGTRARHGPLAPAPGPRRPQGQAGALPDMSCHDARERLSDLLDDALEAEARAQVDAHLAGCADCRRELDRLRATVSLLRAVERPQAPAGFVDRVLEAARPAPGIDGSSIGSPPCGSSDFPSRPPRWCSWPRSPSTSSRDARAEAGGAPGEPPGSGPRRLRVDVRRRRRRRMHARMRLGSRQSIAAEGRSESLRLPPAVPPTAQPMPPLAAPELILKRKAPVTLEERAASLRNSAPASSDPGPREPAPSAPTGPSLPPGAASAPGAAFSSSAEGGLQSSVKDNASGGWGTAERQTSQSPLLTPAPVPPPEPRDRVAREKDQPRSERPAPLSDPRSSPVGAVGGAHRVIRPPWSDGSRSRTGKLRTASWRSS